MSAPTRRRVAATASAVWLTAAVLLAQAPDFSGTWRLDREASTFVAPVFADGRGGASFASLYITHAANGSVTVGTETNGAQAWVYTIGASSDALWGQEGSQPLTTRLAGRRLIAEGVRGAARLREVFTLSADGSRLTVEIAITTPDATRTNTLVYTKDDRVGPCEAWETPCAR